MLSTPLLRALVSPMLAALLAAVPQAAGGSPDAAPGRLLLRNTSWDSVRVEVRIGAAASCDQSPLLAIRYVLRQRSWSVTADLPVCWRREAEPQAPTGVWTPWQRREVGEGSSEEVAL